MSPGQIVMFVIGTVIVIFGAYYVTYFIGVKSTNLRRGAGRSIILRDRFSISKDKSFCLVEIYGKIYVIGVTNQSMTLLDTLSAEEIAEEDAVRQANKSGGVRSVLSGRLLSFAERLNMAARTNEDCSDETESCDLEETDE